MPHENLITSQVEEYIEYKRSLGYKLSIDAEELRRFATFTREIRHSGSLTSELAIRWAMLKSSYSRYYMATRLKTVHTFAKYVIAFDSNAQLPQLGVFGKVSSRTCPYIYTDEEITLLMAEARKLFSPDGIRAYTVSTAIGLLRATGLRVSELTLLKNEDVCLDKGYLVINCSKFRKDRIVPLHPSSTKELGKYSCFIAEKLGQRSDDDYFFVNSYGREFNIRCFEYAFQLIRPILYKDKADDNVPHIRLYDARHTFACETIRHWLESGVDVNQKLHLLSTYMGHVKPEDTYWYLSATPDLLAISCKKYETAFGSELAQFCGEELK